MAEIIIGTTNTDGACSITMTPHFRSLVKDVPTLLRGYTHRGIKGVSFEIVKDIGWTDTFMKAPTQGVVVRHFKKAPPGVEGKTPKLVSTLMRVDLRNGYLEFTFVNQSTKAETKPIRIADIEAILKRFRI